MESTAVHVRSNGKLLLSGEYLVLKGAASLALPTQQGQDLIATPIKKTGISWTSNMRGKCWFRAEFEFDNFAISAASDLEIAEKLQEILKVAKQLNPEFFAESIGYDVVTNLEFERNWGLGSSSTLISNVAAWANCDPFELNKKVFKGSGYDVACARSNAPIIYRLKGKLSIVEEVNFQPEFSDQLFFVWLNRKQSSQQEIGRFDLRKAYCAEIKESNIITREMLNARTLHEFQKLMDQHEFLISKLISTNLVKNQYFPDFEGSIKSLGAWGGDFILVASKLSDEEVKKYFKQKGYTTVLEYGKIIKTL